MIRRHQLPDLSAVDVARTGVDRAHSPTAQALLERIVAEPRTVLATQPVLATRPGAVRSRRARWAALVAVPAVLATAAGVVLTSGSPHAHPAAPQGLDWSPVAQVLPAPAPARAVVDMAEYWTTACSAQPVAMEADLGPGAAAASARATHHVLLERRGDILMCVDVALGDGTPAQPTVALSGTRGEQGTGSVTWWDSPVTPPATGEVTVLDGDLSDVPHRGDADTESVYGMVGPQVTGVEVVLSSGVVVTASVDDGLWAAWWPLQAGRAQGSHLLVTTAQGQRQVDPAAVRVPSDPTAVPVP